MPAEAHALLRRDVDYLVKGGAIEMVDEFKGRSLSTAVGPLEGRHLDQREFLLRYDLPSEGQRNKIHIPTRQAVLGGTTPCQCELERQITLRVIEDLWTERFLKGILKKLRGE